MESSPEGFLWTQVPATADLCGSLSPTASLVSIYAPGKMYQEVCCCRGWWFMAVMWLLSPPAQMPSMAPTYHSACLIPFQSWEMFRLLFSYISEASVSRAPQEPWIFSALASRPVLWIGLCSLLPCFQAISGWPCLSLGHLVGMVRRSSSLALDFRVLWCWRPWRVTRTYGQWRNRE